MSSFVDVMWMVEVQSFPGDSSAVNGKNSMQGMDYLNKAVQLSRELDRDCAKEHNADV